MQIKEENRPPYVSFEYRSVEDRTASIEAGHFVGKEVPYAIITPIGSKDKTERVVEEWFAMLDQQISEGRVPALWLQAYRAAYEQWKEGRELPETGTPILTWPAINASQQKLILDANIRTVEDLAQANESAITALGMGGRALKAKAQAWLESSTSTGKVAEELAALRQRNEELQARIETQATQISELKQQQKLAVK